MNLEALCKEANLELYDSELVSENGKKIYRIYVMKPLNEKGERMGVNLDDCARLSEILSPIFDVEAPVNGEYFLEVSSPGLERKLNTMEHFEKSIGEKVKITTNEKKKFQGTLLEAKNDRILIQAPEEKISIEFTEIKKARTFVEW